jgi:hypothetical protein
MASQSGSRGVRSGILRRVHYAHRFEEHVDHQALLSPAVLFPESEALSSLPGHPGPVIGELLAPVVNAIFWKIAMRLRDGTTGGRNSTTSLRAFTPLFLGIQRRFWHPS